MKKTLICIGLALIPFYTTAANDKCKSNISNEDMCANAKQIAKLWKSALPISEDDRVNVTDVKAENNRVILTTQLKITRRTLENTYKNNDVSLAEGTNSLRAGAKDIVCTNETLTAFVNLGGVMQHEYVFSDGSLLDIVAITSCK